MSADADPRIEGLRGMLDAVERGDRDEFQRLMGKWAGPDCEWSARLADVQGRSYEGREGMVAWFDDFLGSFEVRYLDPELRLIEEEAVLLLTTMRLHGRKSGAEMVQELGVIYEFEGDLMRRGRAYESHAEAIETAGRLSA